MDESGWNRIFDPAGNKFSGLNFHGGSMTGDTISISQVFGGTAILKLQPCAGISITIERCRRCAICDYKPKHLHIFTNCSRFIRWDSATTFKLISITGPNTVNGCTDSNATNYNNLATQDDGNCQYTCDKPNSNYQC